ncbi:hypothetical protein GCM10022248_73420 [Nonomuraea soli]
MDRYVQALYPGCMSADLDSLRSAFPDWSIFRSDTGAFYGTRRGTPLTMAEIDAGLCQTVGADNIDAFVKQLEAQHRGSAA